MRGDPIEHNAELIMQNALRSTGGDAAKALAIVAEFAAWNYAHKGSGIDREGGPKLGEWRPKPAPDAVLIRDER